MIFLLPRRDEVNVWDNNDSCSFSHSSEALKLSKSHSLIFFFQQQALAGTLVSGAGSSIETDPFKRQQAGPPAGMSQSPGPGGLRTQPASQCGVQRRGPCFSGVRAEELSFA